MSWLDNVKFDRLPVKMVVHDIPFKTAQDMLEAVILKYGRAHTVQVQVWKEDKQSPPGPGSTFLSRRWSSFIDDCNATVRQCVSTACDDWNIPSPLWPLISIYCEDWELIVERPTVFEANRGVPIDLKTGSSCLVYECGQRRMEDVLRSSADLILVYTASWIDVTRAKPDYLVHFQQPCDTWNFMRHEAYLNLPVVPPFPRMLIHLPTAVIYPI